MRKHFILYLLLLISGTEIFSKQKNKFENEYVGPKYIIMIRHGEKPTGPKPDKEDVAAMLEYIDLNQKGRERAAALVPYFMGRPELAQYGKPVALFAQYSNFKIKSVRPIKTIQPLADALGLTIDTQFKTDDVEDLITYIKNNSEYKDKMVLICWEHKHIPLIEKAAGVWEFLGKETTFPSVFDRTRIITFDDKGNITDYKDIPQKLLYGDTAE